MINKSLVFAVGITISCATAGYAAGKFLDIGAEEVVHPVEEEVSNDHFEEPELITVELGRILVPIYNAKSINYVVANVGVAVADAKGAEFMKTEAGATKVRNEILVTMTGLAEGSILSEDDIDPAELSTLVMKTLSSKITGVKNVYFTELSKTAVARG